DARDRLKGALRHQLGRRAGRLRRRGDGGARVRQPHHESFPHPAPVRAEQRRREGGARHDLLGMLISARDADTDTAMDDKQLRDEVVTFLVAGHETTAVALSWAWHLLSNHPHVERRLHDEVAAVLGDRVPTMSDLPALT